MLPALLLLPSLVLASGDAVDRRIEEATVTLLPGTCAGVIAGDKDHVVTAAHCVRSMTAQIPIGFVDGRSALATPEAVFYDQDVAVLRLDSPAPFAALEVSSSLPAPGSALYFSGRNDHPDDTLQVATVSRLGPCPSLPQVPAAVHTTIRGEPGDSGAPLVDANMRVVGLVHGGAQCSIAAPAFPAAPVLAMLKTEGAQCIGPKTPSEDELGVGGSGPATAPSP